LFAVSCFFLMAVRAMSQTGGGATAMATSGLLGQRYALLDLAYVDQREGSGKNFGTTVGANFAMVENLDLSVNYAFVRQHDWPDSGSMHSVGFDMTLYVPVWRVKAFGVGGLGYQWSNAQSGQDMNTWDIGGGLEAPINARLAVRARAVLLGSIKSGTHQTWTYSGGANYWLTPSLAATAEIAFIENRAIGYSLGARWKF
jgi:opacity protein-like surface antigen